MPPSIGRAYLPRYEIWKALEYIVWLGDEKPELELELGLVCLVCVRALP